MGHMFFLDIYVSIFLLEVHVSQTHLYVSLKYMEPLRGTWSTYDEVVGI